MKFLSVVLLGLMILTGIGLLLNESSLGGLFLAISIFFSIYLLYKSNLIRKPD